MLKERMRFLVPVTGFLFAAFLSSCYSSQQLVQPSLTQKVSRNPEFLNDISLAGNSRGMAISDNGIKTDKPIDVSLSNTLQVKFGSLMNVLPRAIKNLPMYSFIDEWYGVRYRMGGKDKRGIDCSAFVQRLYEDVFGVNLLRTAFEQFNMSNLLWNSNDLKEGDLVFFRIRTSRISHVGIYLMNNFFVHASSSHGVMISSLNDDYWQRYYACGGRIL